MNQSSKLAKRLQITVISDYSHSANITLTEIGSKNFITIQREAPIFCWSNSVKVSCNFGIVGIQFAGMCKNIALSG
jgi:hypothetical protein